MKQPLFTGACTALVTPFYNGSINLDMLKRLLDRQMAAGIRSIVICGTTGEAPTLSDEEKVALFSAAKAHTKDHCMILAGTGGNDTRHVIALSQAAEATGVDGLLVVSPYYNKATSDGLYAHYAAVAASVHIPILLYNVPSRTGVDIPVSVYKRLAEIPGIAGVKEASADIVKTAKIRSICPSDFAVWSGNDDQAVPVMSLGGLGIISVLSNVAPVETQAMAQAALAGDFDTAAALQIQLLPLIELLFCEVNPIPVKAAMGILGYDCGPCRMPLSAMTKENYARLNTCLCRLTHS